MFPGLSDFTDFGLLLMRLLVALIFAASGWNHLREPDARSKSIGMSKSFTIFLGTAEILGGLGVAFGVLTQLAAGGLILLMLGAIQKKIFVWRTGFWGEKAYGWHYDMMLVVMNLVILFTDGGRFVLSRWLEPSSRRSPWRPLHNSFTFIGRRAYDCVSMCGYLHISVA